MKPSSLGHGNERRREHQFRPKLQPTFMIRVAGRVNSSPLDFSSPYSVFVLRTSSTKYVGMPVLAARVAPGIVRSQAESSSPYGFHGARPPAHFMDASSGLPVINRRLLVDPHQNLLLHPIMLWTGKAKNVASQLLFGPSQPMRALLRSSVPRRPDPPTHSPAELSLLFLLALSFSLFYLFHLFPSNPIHSRHRASLSPRSSIHPIHLSSTHPIQPQASPSVTMASTRVLASRLATSMASKTARPAVARAAPFQVASKRTMTGE